MKTKFIALRWRVFFNYLLYHHIIFFLKMLEISSTFLEIYLLRGSPTTLEGILFYLDLLFCDSLYVDSALMDLSLSVEALLADLKYLEEIFRP